MYAEIAFSIPVEQSFTYKIPEKYLSAAKIGSRALAPFGPFSRRGYITALRDESEAETEKLSRHENLPANLKELKKIIDQSPPITAELMELGRWLSENYACSLGEALDCIFPLPCSAMENRDGSLLNRDGSLYSENHPPEADAKLTAGVPAKSATVGAALPVSRSNIISLSGRNVLQREDIYVSEVEKIAAAGGGCIIVFPDAVSAGVVARRLKVSLGDSVALYHSGLSSTAKTLIWNNCIEGKIKVVAGARAAVFAPVKNLKTIIIENEASDMHKNPQKPFYDTVSIAAERAKINFCSVTLGSIIPSLETFYRVKNDEYNSVTHTRKPPSIVITQIRKSDRHLSPLLKDEIEKRLSKNEFSVIYVNRRGFSGAVSCPLCGDIPKCENCGIPLVFHEKENALKCHYCGYSRAFTGNCNKCEGVYFFIGAGTERILKNLSEEFPAASIERLDSDMLAAENAGRSLLAKIRAGRVDILVATRALTMLYRDLLAPGIKMPTLAAVQNSESLIFSPDFRAIERAFLEIAELSQALAPGGILLLQTMNPEAEFYKFVNKYDWEGYYQKDIIYREELGYPPAVQLVNLILRSKSEKALDESSREVFDLLKEKLDPVVAALLGPDDPPRLKIRGEQRRHILI